MRFTSLLLALGVVVALAWWFVLRHEATPIVASAVTAGAGAGESVADKPVRVMVMESVARDAMDVKVLRGRTEAERLVEVRAETAGLVVSEPLRAGAEVEAGGLLCRLAPGNRLAELAEAKAALAEAEAEANAAQTLSAKGFTAETTRIAREARLQTAAAALELVELDIARLEMRAPFAGVLETDTAEVGSRLGIGDLCATVIDLERVKVTAYVSEQDVDRLNVGDTVAVRLINGETREGRIRFIGRMADERTRTYRVEAEMDNTDGRIRDGMTAELIVELPAERAHLIPQLALTLDDAGRLGVRLAEDGVARFREVRVIRDEAKGVWVAGLPETALIIVVGQEFVRDGRPVEPVSVTREDLG